MISPRKNSVTTFLESREKTRNYSESAKELVSFPKKIAASRNFLRPAVWIDVAFFIFGNSRMHLEKKFSSLEMSIFLS